MIIPHITGDSTGHSLLGTIDLPQEKAGMGLSAALQDVSFWEMYSHEPGDFVDFQPTDANRFLAVLSGQVDLTVSNGDVIRLCRGDMLFQSDRIGQGHSARFVGLEPCNILSIAMPGGFK